MRYRGRIIQVKIHDHGATYSLLAGDPLEITHHGEPLTITSEPQTLDDPARAPASAARRSPTAASRKPAAAATSSFRISSAPRIPLLDPGYNTGIDKSFE